MRRALGFAVAIGLLILGATAVQLGAAPQTADFHYDPNASYDCDRACLNDIVDQYLASVASHDPSKAPLARDVKFSENGQMLKVGDGLWQTASGLPTYKVLADDPEAGEVMFMGVISENGVPAVVGVRLKVELKKITEIETEVSRKQDVDFNHPEKLTDKPIVSEIIPPAERLSRQNMIAIANAYFSAVENNDALKVFPVSSDLVRMTSGDQDCPKPRRGASNEILSCAQEVQLAMYKEDTLIRDRQCKVADVERGLLFCYVYFDHAATLRSWQLTNGTVETASNPGPWSWQGAEFFKIKNKTIVYIEAVVIPVPYRMKPPAW